MDIFCKIINGEIPSKKIYEDEKLIVILDINPKSIGHCLVIPKKHYKDLYDIHSEDLNHIMRISKKLSQLLTKKLGCNGITLEQNNGICQEVKHFHLHIIPKYNIEKALTIDEVFNRLVDNKLK